MNKGLHVDRSPTSSSRQSGIKQGNTLMIRLPDRFHRPPKAGTKFRAIYNEFLKDEYPKIIMRDAMRPMIVAYAVTCGGYSKDSSHGVASQILNARSIHSKQVTNEGGPPTSGQIWASADHLVNMKKQKRFQSEECQGMLESLIITLERAKKRS